MSIEYRHHLAFAAGWCGRLSIGRLNTHTQCRWMQRAALMAQPHSARSNDARTSVPFAAYADAQVECSGGLRTKRPRSSPPAHLPGPWWSVCTHASPHPSSQRPRLEVLLPIAQASRPIQHDSKEQNRPRLSPWTQVPKARVTSGSPAPGLPCTHRQSPSAWTLAQSQSTWQQHKAPEGSHHTSTK